MDLKSLSKIDLVELRPAPITSADQRSRLIKWAGTGGKYLNRVASYGCAGLLTIHCLGKMILRVGHGTPLEVGGSVLLFTTIVALVLGVVAFAEVTVVELFGELIGSKLMKSYFVDHKRFVRANRDRLRRLNSSIRSYNERLEAMNQGQDLLLAEGQDDFDSMVAGLARKRDGVLAEIAEFLSEEALVRKPLVEREAIFKEAKRVEAMLQTFEESAQGAKTLDYTSVSMALRARDSLVERAAALGISADFLPAIPRGLVPKRLPAES